LATRTLFVAATYASLAYVVAPWLWRRREQAVGRAVSPWLTRTDDDLPGDPLNVALVGSRSELLRAMLRAGWAPADAITWESCWRIAETTLLRRAYRDAPVSTLHYRGRRQDLAFEMPVGASPRRRHHVRFWLLRAPRGERPLWIGAASFDRGIGISHRDGELTHHIAPEIDDERQWLATTLGQAACLEESGLVPGIGRLSACNGCGDPYTTDGRFFLGMLRGC